MRVRSAMLFALALPLPGCPSTWKCDPDEREFTLDQDLTEADVQELLTIYGVEDRADLDCARVCEHLEYEASEWFVVGELDACALDLDEPAGADTTEVVGSVSCSGAEIEYYCEGRRPLGHVERETASGLAGYLAGAAHLEAASVLAFEELTAQLRAWGAPEELVRRCQRAAEEERAHAAAVGALAQALGEAPAAPARRPADDDLYSAARHNAVEGCVHETWAALLAWWKASRATTAELRQVYAALAEDELRHAELAWDLHAWMLSRLDPDQAESLRAAQRKALRRLPALAASQAAALPAELGLPEPEHAEAIARRFVAALKGKVLPPQREQPRAQAISLA